MSRSRLPFRRPPKLSGPIQIGRHTLEYSATLRVVVIDQLFLLRFTPIEYRLFSLLLSRAGALVTEEELTEAAFQNKGKNNASDTHLMPSIERHIGALRVKLQNTGLSVLRVVGVGWIFTSDKSQE